MALLQGKSKATKPCPRLSVPLGETLPLLGHALSPAPADSLRGYLWKTGPCVPGNLASPPRRVPKLGLRQIFGVSLMVTVLYSALLEEIRLLQSSKMCLLIFFLPCPIQSHQMEKLCWLREYGDPCSVLPCFGISRFVKSRWMH